MYVVHIETTANKIMPTKNGSPIFLSMREPSNKEILHTLIPFSALEFQFWVSPTRPGALQQDLSDTGVLPPDLCLW